MYLHYLLEIIMIYNTTEIWTALDILAIPLFEHVFCFGNEFVLYFFRTQHIIGRYTCLAAIDQFAPKYAFYSCTQLNGFINVTGTKIEKC